MIKKMTDYFKGLTFHSIFNRLPSESSLHAQFGIESEANKQLKKICITLTTVTIAQTPSIYAFTNSSLYSLAVILYATLYLLVLIPIKRQAYTLCKYCLVCIPCSGIFLFTILLGNKGNINDIFYGIFAFVFCLFDTRRIVHILVSLLIVCLFSLASSHVDISHIHDGLVNPQFTYLIERSSSIITLSMIGVSAYVNAAILTNKNRQLVTLYHERERAIKTSYTSELSGIKKTMVAVAHHVNNLLVTIVTNAYAIQKQSSNDTIKQRATHIQTNGHMISTVIKKLSQIKQVKNTPYADGVVMIDLDGSTYDEGGNT